MNLQELLELEKIGINSNILREKFTIYRKYKYYDFVFKWALEKVKKDKKQLEYLKTKLREKFGIEVCPMQKTH